MHRHNVLRRATGLAGLLAALGVAGSLAAAGVAHAARLEETTAAAAPTSASATTSAPPDNGSAWPVLTAAPSWVTSTSVHAVAAAPR
ncbi:hypothetical protein [Dactylosporangium sp. CS-033363]|uniref:hypothetical protein n=1 Tax=Dactylosporangium sp. CS-033363 TaxID=3239935 RepID=UPI003D928B6E